MCVFRLTHRQHESYRFLFILALEIRMKYFIILTVFCFVLFYFVVVDGAYERSMTVCPPPLTMITFSIVEIIMFLVDIIYLR